jgi:hypothetical protein
MREFPSKFISVNLEHFNQYKYDRDICYLREGIYEHFLNEKVEVKGEDNKPYETPYDIQSFVKQRNPLRLVDMIKGVTAELEKLGWKIVIGYNNSALWMYPKTGKPPKSLPEW